jgi:hypothetical protein
MVVDLAAASAWRSRFQYYASGRIVACIIRKLALRGSQSLFKSSGPAACSMSLPAAIIVEGVPAQLWAAAHMARTSSRLTVLFHGKGTPLRG